MRLGFIALAVIVTIIAAPIYGAIAAYNALLGPRAGPWPQPQTRIHGRAARIDALGRDCAHNLVLVEWLARAHAPHARKKQARRCRSARHAVVHDR
jgi:hypothetical protein